MKTLTMDIRILDKESGEWASYQKEVPSGLSDECYGLIAFGVLALHDWAVTDTSVEWSV